MGKPQVYQVSPFTSRRWKKTTEIKGKPWGDGGLGWFYDDFMGFYEMYLLVNVYRKRTGKSYHAIHGKTLYFDWAIFNGKLINY